MHLFTYAFCPANAFCPINALWLCTCADVNILTRLRRWVCVSQDASLQLHSYCTCKLSQNAHCIIHCRARSKGTFTGWLHYAGIWRASKETIVVLGGNNSPCALLAVQPYQMDSTMSNTAKWQCKTQTYKDWLVAENRNCRHLWPCTDISKKFAS